MKKELNEKKMENIVGGAPNSDSNKKAVIDEEQCVGCGCCDAECPVCAITPVPDGVAYRVDRNLCIGCGKCERECPMMAITMVE